jgi:hypothetical protein
MDANTLLLLFNIVVGVCGALGGWWLKTVWDNQVELARDLVQLRAHITETYARRDDFKNTVDALFAKLDRIEEKLDRKADKS